MDRRIYLDNAATTSLDPRVESVMQPFWSKNFGNPGGIYKEGREAKVAINSAREKVAELVGAKSSEIIFTGGGTESNNLAIFGVLRHSVFPALQGSLTPSVSTPHIITTKIEHKSVLEPFRRLASEGFDVTYLPVGEDGIVDPKDLKEALKPETILVSVMYANNEIGTIQPIAELSKIIKKFKKDLGVGHLSGCRTPLFHTDACQASPYLEMSMEKLGVDLMSVNGPKMYGPKGTGFLAVKNLLRHEGIKLEPILYGGGQERGVRAGTENVPGIIGLAESFKLARELCKSESERIAKLRDKLIDGVLSKITNTHLNGSRENRLPNNANFSFLGVEGEAIVLYLDEFGIACSTGSACNSDNFEPSYVITSIGRRVEYAHSSIRFSLGRSTTSADIDYLLEVLPGVIEKLRSVSAVK